MTATDNRHAVPIPALVKNNKARQAQGTDVLSDNTLGILMKAKSFSGTVYI